MGILDFLKQKAKPVSLEESKKIAMAEFDAEKNEIIDFSSKKFAEIKHLSIRLTKSASLFENHKIDLDEGNKRYRQIVVTSQKNLVRQLKGISKKIVPPTDFETNNLREYITKSTLVITNDLMPYWKNIALAKLMLKDEVNSIGDDLKELLGALEQLHKKAFSEKLINLEKINELLEKIEDNKKLLEELDLKISDSKNKLKEKEKIVVRLDGKISDKKNSKEVESLNEFTDKKERFEKQKQELVSNFNSELAPIEKILKRLQSAAESTKMLDRKEKELLGFLLETPALAITLDPKGTAFKNVIVKAEKLVKEGTIPLKDKEKEKKFEALSKLMKKDFFSDYFWKLNNVQSDLNQVEKRIAGLDISAELKTLEADLKTEGKELSQLNWSVNKLESEKISINEEILLLDKKNSRIFNLIFDKKFEVKN
ncbi:MAG: hypothetical protein CL944_03120 [Candidatus Diapherotrites archaeon]|uniref:Uncharacterized protein n=1 Tax=Candidatus Iainarchaeum sp. TaxID=3101447 RepID=A0A2D6LQH2_9ARCH|nr:hypothetical protein [Candidatus Diapherotrites archaeon]|tara:strand:+ start:3988 stop:5265 length:1278 start_codon:yes stop_codon:yes gene_type:complete